MVGIIVEIVSIGTFVGRGDPITERNIFKKVKRHSE